MCVCVSVCVGMCGCVGVCAHVQGVGSMPEPSSPPPATQACPPGALGSQLHSAAPFPSLKL